MLSFYRVLVVYRVHIRPNPANKMAAYVSNTYRRQTGEKGSFNKIETFAASPEKCPPLIKRDNPKLSLPAPKALFPCRLKSN